MAKPREKTQKTLHTKEAASTGKAFDFEALTSRLNLILFPVYLIAIAMGVIHHESWADEAQSWLLVKDLSLPELFKVLPAEGHPPLWYIILLPFAKLGFPYAIVKWIAASFMAGAVFLLLFKTKTSAFIKLTVPFSYYFLYQYTVFGRSYSLVAFFLMAIVSLYPRRFDKPWLFALCVAALFNTHMLAYTFTFALNGLYLLDAIQYKKLTRNVIGALILMAVSGLYLIPFFTTNDIVTHFTNTLTDRYINIERLLNHGIIPTGSGAWVGVTFLTILAISLLSRAKALFLLIAGVAGVLYIFAYKYTYIQPRHYGVLILVLLGSFCIAPFYKDDKYNVQIKDLDLYGNILLALMFLAHIQAGFTIYGMDKDRNYSDAKNVAEFIVDNKLEKSIIVGHDAWAAMAVLPYLPDGTKLYDPKCKRFFRHYQYDTCFTSTKPFEMSGVVFNPKDAFPTRLGEIIFITNFEIKLQTATYMELLYSSPSRPIYEKETFNVYRFKKKGTPGSIIQ